MGDLLSVKQLYDSINGIPGRNITFSPNQKQIIEFGTGPLWIIAGPGSGKTESLVLRCLKLLFVDGIKPRSIMITTFTEKAGQNLKDRLINYKAFISKQYPQINKIDLFQLRSYNTRTSK